MSGMAWVLAALSAVTFLAVACLIGWAELRIVRWLRDRWSS